MQKKAIQKLNVNAKVIQETKNFVHLTQYCSLRFKIKHFSKMEIQIKYLKISFTNLKNI